jgi:hypothetical protein
MTDETISVARAVLSVITSLFRFINQHFENSRSVSSLRLFHSLLLIRLSGCLRIIFEVKIFALVARLYDYLL